MGADFECNCTFLLINAVLVQPESHQQTVIKRMGEHHVHRRHLLRQERKTMSLTLQFA